MTTNTAQLIVCECSAHWEVALRQELVHTGVRVRESRSLQQCWDALADAPASFVVVELTVAAAGDLLRRMARLPREFPLVRVAVVADRSLAEYEWLLRESGAIHFTCSPRRLAPVAEMACRHLAAAPVRHQSFTERVWDSLPWEAAQEDQA